MFKEEVKNNMIVGVEVAAVAAGALAGIAVVGGLKAVLPADKILVKVGICAAGLGIEYAAAEMMTKAGINTLAIIDKVGDRIIENRKNKPEKEKKVKVKNRSIKEVKAFKKSKKLANNQ